MEINIKTKFNVGDSLLYFNPSTYKLEDFVVDRISCTVSEDKTEVFYFDEAGTCRLEYRLFASKDEFIASI